jgi:hypothetical protein
MKSKEKKERKSKLEQKGETPKHSNEECVANDDYHDVEIKNVFMNGIVSELMSSVLNCLTENDNYNKVQHVFSYFISIMMQKISPYLYSIMAILIIMFIMNCFQFYYYIKLMLHNNVNVANLITEF